MIWITGLFALVALVYASVGFGGGSTYTALLGLWGVDYQLIPVISLLCNIIVVTGGSIRFVRAGLVKWPQVVPLLLVSAPLAFIGGLVPLKQWLFLMILGGFDRPARQNVAAQIIEADIAGDFRGSRVAGWPFGYRRGHFYGASAAPDTLG
jgi:hypothetical protein